MKYFMVILTSLLTFGCQSTNEEYTTSFQKTINNMNIDSFKKDGVDVVLIKVCSLKDDNECTSEHTVKLDESASVKSTVSSPLGTINSMNLTYTIVDDELSIELDEYTTDGIYPSKNNKIENTLNYKFKTSSSEKIINQKINSDKEIYVYWKKSA